MGNAPRERQRRQLERKQNRRASYDRILIISESSKTEPNYFGETRTTYHLPTAMRRAGALPAQFSADSPSEACSA